MPKVETENICPYCKIPMLRRRTREKIYYSESIRCENCGHLHTVRYRGCDCVNCQNRKIEIREKKKKAIFKNYSELIPTEKVEFNNLKFENQCLLYILYCETGKYNDFNNIENGLIHSNTIRNLIKQLKTAGILYVAPDSPVSAFYEENFPFQYDSDKVNYIVNVSFTESDELKICNRAYTANEVPEGEIKKVLHELIYADLLSEFEKLLEKRNISFEPTKKQLREFRELLNELSYTQISFLCYKVAQYYNDGITTHKIYRNKAPQQVFASVSTFYRNYQNWYGDVYHGNVEYVGKVLRNFIENILKQDISILDDII